MGCGQYRLFLEYIGESNNNQAGKIKTLQNAFDELTTILKRCLDLHGRIVPESMRLSHQALVELFEKILMIELRLRIHLEMKVILLFE